MLKLPSSLYEEAEGEGGGGGEGAANGQQQQVPPGQQWYQNWIKPDWSFNHDALDKAPDDFKQQANVLKRYPKFEDFAGAFLHQNKLISSGKALEPLRAGATEEERQAHNATLRRVLQVPENPEGYGFKRPDSIPEDMWSDELTSTMSKKMHEAGVAPEAAKVIFDSYNEFMAQSITASQQQEQQQVQQRLAEANAMLDKEWGLNRPRMEQMAQRGALTAGLDINDPLFQDPRVKILCGKFATEISEDKLVGPPGGAPDQPSIQQRWDAINNDPHSKYYEALWNPNHPNHEAAKKEWDILSKLVGQEQDRQRV